MRQQDTLAARLKAVIPWVIGVMTLMVLVFNLPSGELLSLYSEQALRYTFLTAFVLFFGVWLSEGELSPAHIVGMGAFFSLEAAARPLLLWSIFLGGLMGALALNLRLHTAYRNNRQRISGLIFLGGRVALSFFAAGEVYIALNGILPLERGVWHTNSNALLTIALYVLVYITVYTSIFVLELYASGRHIQNIVRTNLSLILTTLLLPVPFVILSAEIAGSLSVPSEVINILWLPLIVLGLHALSRSEYQLYKQLNELRTLSVVTRAVRAHLELDTLLKTIYLQVAHLLDVQNFRVALYNREKEQLEFALVIYQGQESEANQRMPLSERALITHVMHSGTPLVISRDVQAVAREMFLQQPDGMIQSWMAVPLMAGGQKLGVIEVTSNNLNHHFNQNDLRLLNIVASSASIAIENAQLYEQQTERLEQMSALNNIAALLSGTLSPDNVLDTVISSASAISQSSAVAVYLVQDDASDKDDLPMVRSAGLSDAYTVDPPRPLLLQTSPDVPLHLRMPVAIGNIDRAEQITRELHARLKQEHKVALVELPLAIGERALGIITAFFEEPQTFTGEYLELLRTFATQVAQAITNARTYASTDEAFQRSMEQLTSLATIGSALNSTVELNKICDLVLGNAIKTMQVEAGVVAVYIDDDNKQLQVMAQTGYPAGAFDDPAVVAGGISYHALTSGIPQHIGDVADSPHYIALNKATRSQISVPIKRGETAMGYITLESATVNGFSTEDRHFIGQIANQAAIAVDNARLFRRITEARDRLQVILDTMDEGIILIDTEEQIALANPRIDLLGLGSERLLNRPLAELIGDDSLTLHQHLGFETPQALKRLVYDIQTDGLESYEPLLYTLQVEQITRYIQRLVIPVPDESGQPIGAMLVFYDKTEEQELGRARDEFSRMLVHDLRSPLTAVTTSLKLLRDIVPDDSEFRDVVVKTTEASRRAIRKLLGRVDSLLDISKMQSGRLGIEPDLIEFPTLIDNVRNELDPLAQELDIRIVSQVADDMPPLNIDSDKVERLLLNLVDNALKYSPMGGQIIIRSHDVDDNGFIRLDVVDSGPGIPDDYRETLFNAFTQIEGRRRVRRGVGLGLAFCKLVTEAHGGRIWIEDNPKGGTVFAFTLPTFNMERLPEDEDEFPISAGNSNSNGD